MCWELVKSKGMPCQSPKRVSSTSPARQAIRSHSLAHKSACDLSWASDIEPGTVEQAARTARLPFVEAHVALMPDAHVGVGSTVGSVIPTRGAIIPSCVGVDIGCGMVASETSLTGWQEVTTTTRLGTLGSGNHFGEVCLGGRDRVWTVLHSGSRGIGNQLSVKRIEAAKGLLRERFIVDSLRTTMTGRSWNADAAEKLLDEHPSAYKDIDQVMADMADLVTIQHTLSQVFNDKGV